MEGDGVPADRKPFSVISIHSLRMEGDKLIKFWAENK